MFFGAEEAVYHNQLSKLWVTLRGFCSCQPSMPRDVRRRPARKPARRIRHNYSYEVKCSYNGRMNQARFISWLKEECAKQVSGRTLRLTMQAANSKKLKDKYNYNIRCATCTKCSFRGRGLCDLSTRKMRLRATPALAHGDFLRIYRKPTDRGEAGGTQ